MRNYPPPSEYEKMLGNAQAVRIAFRDSVLKGAEVEKTPLGLPRARSGAFAVVYRAFLQDGSSKAIRLFLKDGDDRQERYQAVYQHVSQQSMPCLVPFTYEADSFRAADGSWYPMMTMEWVKGETLFDWLQHRAEARDKKAIRLVAEKWQKTIQDLSKAKIAHGDLQHGNVMITPGGDVKLVDYDGMCVPALVGRRNLEIGVEPYQHPSRDGETKLSLDLDNFSAAFIYVGLRALAVEPDLWDEFVVKPEYDKMLFRKEDFLDPRQSALFQRLRRSSDSDVQRLATTLHEVSRVEIDQVPFLDDLLFSWDQVNVVLGQRDFGLALELVSRGGKVIADAPPALQSKLVEAKGMVSALDSLLGAVDAGDEPAMAKHAASQLLKGYPRAADALEMAADAPAVASVITKLENAWHANDGRRLVAEWDAAKVVLCRPKGKLRRSAEKYQQEVESWRNRNGLCDTVLRGLKSAEPDVSTIVTAWKALAKLGGHPECDSQKNLVSKWAERDRAWRVVVSVGSAVDEKTDKAFLQAWNEKLFANWKPAEAVRARLGDGKRRLKITSRVLGYSRAPVSWGDERQVLLLAKDLPRGYSPEVESRCKLAKNRLAAAATLQDALKADVDSSIADAFAAVRKAEAASIVDSAAQSRIDIAVKRQSLIARLKKIPASYANPIAVEWDSKLLSVWDDDLLATCREVNPWRDTVEKCRRRKSLLAELDQAVKANDAFRAFDLAGYPVVDGYKHHPDIAMFLRGASQDVASVRGMLNAFAVSDAKMFAASFSAGVIRSRMAIFAEHWESLVAWTRDVVLSCESIGLGNAKGVKGVESRPAGPGRWLRMTVRWKWPESRFSDECVVVLCKNKPRQSDVPSDVDALIRIPKTRALYESAGGFHSQQVNAAWAGCYVVVWAKVDFGEDVLWSEPFVIGKV